MGKKHVKWNILKNLFFQITAIVLAAVYKQQAETHTKEFFQHTLRKYYTTKERRDAVTLSWDFMMAEVNILIAISLEGPSVMVLRAIYLTWVRFYASLSCDLWLLMRVVLNSNLFCVYFKFVFIWQFGPFGITGCLVFGLFWWIKL